MLTIPEYGSAAAPDGRGIVSTVKQMALPDGMGQEIIDFLFCKKRWHEDVEIVHDRVRRWRQAIRAYNAAPPPVVPIVPEVRHPWLAQAVSLRGDGMSWRAVARKVGQPEPTVRRLVTRAVTPVAA